MPVYADTSALVKLVIAEAESAVLTAVLADVHVMSSSLVRTEVRRAVRRHPNAAAADRADDLLESVELVRIDDSLLDHAGFLAPTTLRSLDAVHVSTALSLRDRLDYLVTYDDRMADAARSHGLRVSSPGRMP